MNITKSGLVALVGRPNVGKSTLLNRLAGEKIAIVSDKPQTTRRRISAVVVRGACQFVFLDTPGFHKPRNRLGEYMLQVARDSAGGVDAVALVVEPIPRVGTPETLLLERLSAGDTPVLLVINKVDTVPKASLLPVIEAYRQAFRFAAVVPLSAREGDGTDLLLNELEPLLPEGPPLYPEGQVTDQPERELIAELVREKLLNHLDKEVPHGVAVMVDTLRERENKLVEISVTILCEKESHKGILIGKRGAMLKTVGEEMRAELEEMYEGPVLFQSWVKVRADWRNNPGQLHNLGFDTGALK
ncbi:MAG: GTPase Era [Oscillospiraceae bacterium]|jgi:GTP-binding protein Era|nr:GTPase Era [Oscillospiraceae bacterium]